MTSKDKLEDPEAFDERVAALCDVYAKAPAFHAEGVHVVSTDEKTGMQALERKFPTKPTRPGLIELREFEYIRHGTLCLTANLEIATGSILSPRIEETRTKGDFVDHISNTISIDPGGRWIFVVDNLDTHKSEDLVRYVASQIGDTSDLGELFVSGVLRSRASRTEYLERSEHRIRFLFTPRHCSWLNQIELWFSMLARRFLRRASFTSKEDLKSRLLAFIDYFNAVLAKPYRWTYTGRLLAA
jgi:transposase